MARPNVLGLLAQTLTIVRRGGALYGVIDLSFLGYALVPGVAFSLDAWAPNGDHTARG